MRLSNSIVHVEVELLKRSPHSFKLKKS